MPDHDIVIIGGGLTGCAPPSIMTWQIGQDSSAAITSGINGGPDAHASSLGKLMWQNEPTGHPKEKVSWEQVEVACFWESSP